MHTAHFELRLFAACALLVGLLAVVPLTAQAQSASDGVRTLTVSKSNGLDPDGEVVTVSGSGYDVEKGIYVAFCLMPPPGQVPTPCGGGVDLSGTSGSSAWISSNPPAYGVGLAQPYGEGGTFTVTMALSSLIGDTVDCRTVQCAVVTRSDHTRTSDRSQDVFVPVSFATPGEEPTEPPATPTPPLDATPTPTLTPTPTPTPLPTRPAATVSPDGLTATAGALRVSVAATKDLDPDGATIRVEGAGFDVTKGVYVALCALPANATTAPGPCTSGAPELAAWISSNPPDWGKDLAVAYATGGAFSVELTVPARIDAGHDCRNVACAIVTRNDDTIAADRSQDLFLPVAFAAQASSSATPSASATANGSATAVPSPSASPTTAPPADISNDDGGGTSPWLWAGLVVALLAIGGGVGAFFLRRGRGAGIAAGCLALTLLALLVAGCGDSSKATSSPSPSPAVTTTATTTTMSRMAAQTDVTLPEFEGDPPIVVIDHDPGPPQLPVTVHSADGRDVTVTDVSRIVSLWGNLTEVVFGLGLGGNVVGRDVTATFPEASHIPLVTRGHDISVEGVLSLHPTVVLASKDNSVPAAMLDHIRNVGIPVVFFEDPWSVDDVVPRIRELATALGVPAAGDELARVTEARMALVLANIPDPDNPPRVAFLYMRGTAGVYLIAGPHSGADSMIVAAGGLDAGTEMGLSRTFTPITSEALVDAAPDVILMTTSGLESVGGIDGLVKIPGIGQTPAGKNRRVVTMEDGLLYSFGPRTPFALDRLSKAIFEALAAPGQP